MSAADTGGLKIPFGKKNERLYSPSQVTETGLACGCACPGCGARLVARKESLRSRAHFAHYKKIAVISCVESAIHQAAKQVLLDEEFLYAPAMTVSASAQCKSGEFIRKSRVLAEPRLFRFDYCEHEVRLEEVTPDVVGYRVGQPFYVEMYFRHKVDGKKRKKLARLDAPAIEVDLSNIDIDEGFNAVRMRVLYDVAEKTWLHYPGMAEALHELRAELAEAVQQRDLHFDREEAAERGREERREQAAALRMAEIAAANERYRALSETEKHTLISKDLVLAGPWPRHLNVQNPENAAIPCSARLWQGAFFARFIFRRPAHSTFTAETALAWIAARFGVVAAQGADAKIAVSRFLAYLKGCGFIRRNSSYGDNGDYYVLHNELQPPPRAPKPPPPEVTQEKEPQKVEQQIVQHEPSLHETFWIWRASWPSKAELIERAKPIAKDTAEWRTLLQNVEVLVARDRPREPMDFARFLELQGIPRNLTLNTLVGLGLAIAGKRLAHVEGTRPLVGPTAGS